MDLKQRDQRVEDEEDTQEQGFTGRGPKPHITVTIVVFTMGIWGLETEGAWQAGKQAKAGRGESRD